MVVVISLANFLRFQIAILYAMLFSRFAGPIQQCGLIGLQLNVVS